MSTVPLTDHRTALQRIVGAPYVLTDPVDTEPYLTDWRKRYQGPALAIVLPANTHEVIQIVRYCAAHRIAIVPQGGNTSLCGAATPNALTNDKAATASASLPIVLSLKRLQAIRQIDPINNTLTVEAGCILAQVQAAAFTANRLFPLSLAAEGSCTIGGNLSTNAGGTAVLRYGNTRELTLGLEVVTPQGELWNGLSGLRKDNTGYDLRDLFIGAEGTLGIITAATLKLFPLPVARATALVALETIEQALALLSLAQQKASAGLTTFELISDVCQQLVQQHFQIGNAFSNSASHVPPYAVLLELSDHESEQHAQTLLETILQEALEAELITDAVLANSLQQAQQLWQRREWIPEAQAKAGYNIKHDISLPISQLAAFCAQCNAAIRAAFPAVELVIYGHVGDGNLHYNVAPGALDIATLLAQQETISTIVYDHVKKYHGSISAEHGIGQSKRQQLAHYKDPTALLLMRSIKQAIDPLNMMNPGKIFS